METGATPIDGQMNQMGNGAGLPAFEAFEGRDDALLPPEHRRSIAGASPEHRRSIPGTWSARYALTRLSITQTSNWLIIDIDYRLINSGRPWTANPTPGSKYSLNYRLTRVWNIDTLKGRGGEGRGGNIPASSPHHPKGAVEPVGRIDFRPGRR